MAFLIARCIASVAALVAALLSVSAAAPAPPFEPEGDRVANVLHYGDFYRVSTFREVEGEGEVEFVSWLTLDGARAADESEFHALSEGLDNDGFYYGYVWMRLRLTNSGERTRVWRLFSTGLTSASWVEGYLVEPDGSTSIIWRDPIGENPKDIDYTFNDRTPMFRNSVSHPFAIRPGETVEIWLDYPNGAFTEFGPDLIDADAFLRHEIGEAAFDTYLFGLRTALLFAIFAFALILRSKVALYYGLFTGALFVFFSGNLGYLTTTIFRNVDIASFVATFAGVVAFVFFVQMTRTFLNSPRLYPCPDKILLGTLAFGALDAALSVAIFGNTVLMLVGFIPGLLAIISVTMWAAFTGVRNRHTGAGIYFVAALFLFGNIAFGLLSYPPLYLVSADLTSVITHAGLTVDGVLFAGALVLQALGLRRERDEAHTAEVAALKEKASLTRELSDVSAAHDRALSLAEARRRELAATTHDLKQPLLSLQMALKKRTGTDSISEGISYLESVINRSLDTTRPEDVAAAPVNDAEKPPFALGKALANVAMMFGDEALEKGLELTAAPTSLQVRADPVVIMRILSNLVANAVKHTSSGRLLIGARRTGGTVRIDVLDTGAGMTPEALETALRPYQKGSASRGEGLGLAVVREMAEANGCELIAASAPGQGTRFSLAGLPRATSGGAERA